jgi:type I restriction enzyme, S subunit
VMTTSLGSVCKFLNGGTPSKAVPEYFEGDIPWITSADISGPVANFARSFITDEAVKSSAVNKVAAGAVLLVTRTGVGKVAVAANELCFSQDITALLPDERRLMARYLVHFLRTKKEHFLGLARGATIQGITRNVVSDLSIPLPPLPEQNRIAAILDQADALRAKRREALAQLNSLTQSIFIEMFGDPTENVKGLPVDILGALCKRITDGTHQSPKWETTGIPFLFISNIVDGHITFDTHKFISDETYVELTRRCPIELGDVLYTTVGSYGNAAVVRTTERFAFQRHIAHIKPDISRATPTFIAAMIQSTGVRRQVDKVAKGVAQKTVNLADLKNLLVFTPPLHLQQTFATRIQGVEALKASHRTALQELDRLFASLQHRAFSGEL